MTIGEQKQALRDAMKDRIKTLSSAYKAEADQKILNYVKSLGAYQQAETVFCYVGGIDEIHTSLFIEDALREGKRVAVPRCEGNGIMHAYVIRSLNELEKGYCGILEPVSGCVRLEPEEIRLAVVPCLSADHSGHRLGYGGGYYDRYLQKTECPTVLLCRESMILQEIPLETHDLTMDLVVTENGIYQNSIF